MAFFKVKVQREFCSSPRIFNVVASKSQSAIQAAALQLREEGITDAKGIEVMGQVQSLRD